MKKYKLFLISIIIFITALILSCFVPIKSSKLIPIIEQQIANEIGAKVHIEKLILRGGPYLKLKAPILHVLYEDGQKFAQFDNVKFYISWISLIKNKPVVSKIYANKLTARINSDDAHINDLLQKNNSRNIKDIPNIHFKSYKLSYKDNKFKNTYIFEGQNLLISKVPNFKNLKISSTGIFSIGNVKYVNYDINILPNFDLPQSLFNLNLINCFEQIKELDFHSDIIADLKLYKNAQNELQASGFINIDNISVLDFAKKNPKSFAYLTLWGDKASILSNIYASTNQKIYIEGMFNNSKKTSLDLKVKTDEISLSDLHNKLKILSGFSGLKSIDSLNGKLIANFTIKGDLAKIKSNGYLKLINASVLADGVKIYNINSDIDLSNNKIDIKEAVGYVNNAAITAKGYIDKKINIQLKMDKIDLKHFCPASLGVQSGILSLLANFSGTVDSVIHKEYINVDDFNIVNKNINLSFDNLTLDTNKNNVALVNNIVCKTPELSIIKIPSLKAVLEKNSLRISDTNLFMPNSKLVFNSIVDNIFNYNINFKGFINSKDIERFKDKSQQYPLITQIYGNKNAHNINSQILIENTEFFDEPMLINLVTKIDKNILKIDDISLLTFNGSLKEDYKANLKGQRKVTITGSAENLKAPNFKNLRVFIPQQLCMHIYDTILQFKGDVFINNNYLSPDIVGQIVINNLHNQLLQLSLTNAVFDFNKNLVQVNAPSIKIHDSSISANGNISTDFTNGIKASNFNIKSKFINTDTLLMYKDSPITNTWPIKLKDCKFYSEKVLANIYNSPIYLYAFSSDIDLDDSNLILKNISSDLFNGKLGGSLKYNLRDEEYNTDIMARGVSAEPIFNIISTRKDNISGSMDFDAILKGNLTSKESLNGNIKFIVNNGRMSSLGKLEHLLYAQNVIADNMLRTSLSVVTKAITLKDTGLFKYLRGDVNLQNGIANINFLQSQGPLMALFMKGQFNPINNDAKLIVLGRLSDEIVSGLGAFGDFSLNKLMVMLTGEESRTYINQEDLDKLPQLPMKNTKEFRSIINGNIDKPSSVILFNWISYSQKSLIQKDVPLLDSKVPSFIEKLPY